VSERTPASGRRRCPDNGETVVHGIDAAELADRVRRYGPVGRDELARWLIAAGLASEQNGQLVPSALTLDLATWT
jgi:hypothetical protein